MLMLMSTALWADETVTVSANSSDISDGLDLKVVAKLFAEAKNLEEFETMLNNPDSTFCNLDLNGDGQVDYLRVVETGEGNKRLIVLQAVLAKDIYQDVASIYVEKNEKDEVSVQVVGDEYVYGTNYIIEPVYVYRPVIYDWFWSDAWYAWHSPWYWGYYPGWWYVHSCWAHDRYWHHCYTFHHYHHNCSFRHGREARHGYREMHNNVARRDMATAQPERSFSQRNSGLTNARDIHRTSGVQTTRQAHGGGEVRGAGRPVTSASAATTRTYGSQHTAAARGATSASTRNASTGSVRSTSSSHAVTRSTSSSPAVTRGTSTSVATTTRGTTNATTTTRTTTTRSTSTANPRGASAASHNASAPSTHISSTPAVTRSSSSFSSGASHSAGSYSGGGAVRSSSSGFSGGGASRGGGGGSVRR